MLTRRHCLSLIGIATCLPRAARAADLASDVRARLADAPVLSGDFEQTRTLQGFRNPLVSRGDFLLLRSRGVVWRTRAPFASTLVVTRERLLSRTPDGAVNMQLDARSEPGLRAVNEVMFALLSGDLATLARHFRIEGELLDATGWRLLLTPADALLAGQFGRLLLEGDRYVRQVQLEERGGDRTLIRFSALRAALEPTREEEARFGPAGS
jgi:hypothetical protein